MRFDEAILGPGYYTREDFLDSYGGVAGLAKWERAAVYDSDASSVSPDADGSGGGAHSADGSGADDGAAVGSHVDATSAGGSPTAAPVVMVVFNFKRRNWPSRSDQKRAHRGLALFSISGP